VISWKAGFHLTGWVPLGPGIGGFPSLAGLPSGKDSEAVSQATLGPPSVTQQLLRDTAWSRA
jgi:hypothetical protein